MTLIRDLRPILLLVFVVASSAFVLQTSMQRSGMGTRLWRASCRRLALGMTTLTSAVADSNALLEQSGLPQFKSISAPQVRPAVEVCLKDMQDKFQGLEEQMKAEQKASAPELYQASVEEMEKIQAPLTYAWGVVGHLMGVKNSPELRSEHESMQPMVVQQMQAMGQSKPLYDVLKAISEAEDFSALPEAQQRIVISNLRSMEQSGIGLEGETREEFNKLQLEAAELSTKFSNNVLDSTKAFRLDITDKAELEGLPPSALALAASQNAAEDATPEAGPYTITLDIPSYLPAMQHLKNRELREKLYRAYVTRAASGDVNNEDYILRILQIRKKMAEMLDKPNYAAVSLDRKMAPSIESVTELSEMLREKAYPAAVKELEDLQKFAQEEYGFEGELQLWDVPFYAERLREKLYSYTEEELRPYFSLANVLDGLFSLAQRLFDVTIEETKEDVEVWHPDVTYYVVKDGQTGEQIASFFLDPFSRPAEKRGGAWMDVCVGKSKVLSRKPVAYLTCNGSPPVGDKPSLMTFREVETLFHEFGHGLQHMLTQVDDGGAAGINNVEWDAVELPSQFMENWCYDEKTALGIAVHYETGEPLPKELFQKICDSRHFMAGSGMLRQLYFGQLDMALHADFDPESGASPFDLQKEIASRYTVMKPLPEDRFLCSFGHIFAGGYAAGYYSYKWAEILSADAFSAFEEAGLDNEEEVRTIGRRFRDTVLGMGGGKHPSEVFKLFRGRDPSPEPLLRHSGLVQ